MNNATISRRVLLRKMAAGAVTLGSVGLLGCTALNRKQAASGLIGAVLVPANEIEENFGAFIDAQDQVLRLTGDLQCVVEHATNPNEPIMVPTPVVSGIRNSRDFSYDYANAIDAEGYSQGFDELMIETVDTLPNPAPVVQNADQIVAKMQEYGHLQSRIDYVQQPYAFTETDRTSALDNITNNGMTNIMRSMADVCHLDNDDPGPLPITAPSNFFQTSKFEIYPTAIEDQRNPFFNPTPPPPPPPPPPPAPTPSTCGESEKIICVGWMLTTWLLVGAAVAASPCIPCGASGLVAALAVDAAAGAVLGSLCNDFYECPGGF